MDGVLIVKDLKVELLGEVSKPWMWEMVDLTGLRFGVGFGLG